MGERCSTPHATPSPSPERAPSPLTSPPPLLPPPPALSLSPSQGPIAGNAARPRPGHLLVALLRLPRGAPTPAAVAPCAAVRPFPLPPRPPAAGGRLLPCWPSPPSPAPRRPPSGSRARPAAAAFPCPLGRRPPEPMAPGPCLPADGRLQASPSSALRPRRRHPVSAATCSARPRDLLLPGPVPPAGCSTKCPLGTRSTTNAIVVVPTPVFACVALHVCASTFIRCCAASDVVSRVPSLIGVLAAFAHAVFPEIGTASSTPRRPLENVFPLSTTSTLKTGTAGMTTSKSSPTTTINMTCSDTNHP